MNQQIAVLYALGGLNSEAIKSVSFYDSETDSWDTVPTEIPFPRTNFGCVGIDDGIFVIGGSNGWRDMETMFRLDTGSGQWDECPPMKYPRQGCGAACSADGKYIYVAGGWDGEKCWDDVERFSLEDREWTTVMPMSVAKTELQLVELGRYLYALGGFNNSLDCTDRESFSVAERYDPETDRWSPIAPMKRPYFYYSCGAAVLDGKIFVLGRGGFEMYSPEEDRWTELPAPVFCPSARRLVAINGELFAVGGRVFPMDDSKNCVGIDFVESFDVEKQIWSRKSDMDIGRAYAGVVVVNQCLNDC